MEEQGKCNLKKKKKDKVRKHTKACPSTSEVILGCQEKKRNFSKLNAKLLHFNHAQQVNAMGRGGNLKNTSLLHENPNEFTV